MSCNHTTVRNDKPEYKTANYTCTKCGKDFRRLVPKNKYDVVLGRGDLAAITESIVDAKKGERQTFLFKHRGRPYEVRAERKAHGYVIDWGVQGTFFLPDGYYNSEEESPAQVEQRLSEELAVKKQKGLL